MTTTPRIEVADLTKRYGARLALDTVSCSVEPGTLLGLLGPNGSGKTTLLRVLLGLERPSAGVARINGRAMARAAEPAHEVGALLDPGWFHPARSARAHLRWMVHAARLPVRRIDEVLETVGLAGYGDDRVGSYSLGMRQRLGVAGALLGDPAVLVFDEPFNGLDQEAVAWLAGLAAERVARGGIVIMSSHQLAELEPLVDRLLVLGRGRTLFEGRLDDAVRGLRPEVVAQPLVASEHDVTIRRAAEAAGLEVHLAADGAWHFVGGSLTEVSMLLARCSIPLRHIEERGVGLRDAYHHLVAESALPLASGLQEAAR